MDLKKTLEQITYGNDNGNIVIGYCKDNGNSVLQYMSEDFGTICMHRDERIEEIDEMHLFIKINQTMCHCKDLQVEDVDFN